MSEVEIVEEKESLVASLGEQVEGLDHNVVDDRPAQLLIIQLDVGQGECTLLIEQIGGENRWVGVIDGGFATAGRGSLSRYLEAFGVKTIDAMFCSHFDGDHTKGLVSYLKSHAEHTPVTTLYVRNTDPRINKSSTKVELLLAARDAGTDIVEITVEQTIRVPKGCPLSIKCIYVDNSGTHDENACSISLLLEYGKFRYYTAGDLPSSIELTLLGAIGTIDAFKCGHHGSANSTPPELLETCKPRLAFISCGEQNYGHPTYDVIERLMTAQVRFYLTNCIHNRRGLHTRYLAEERAIAKKIQAALEECRDDLLPIHTPDPKPRPNLEHILGPSLFDEPPPSSGPVYRLDAIEANLQTLDTTPRDGERDRVAFVLLRGAARAAEHEQAGFQDYDLGTVAGNNQFLGTIALRCPFSARPAACEVGYIDRENRWKWDLHAPRISYSCESEKVRLQHRDFVSKAIITGIRNFVHGGGYIEISPSDQPRLQPGKIGSPNKYEEHLTKREECYRVFSAPTTVGLRESARGKPVVPFCFYCHVDLRYLGSGDLLELVQVRCSECEDDALFVHLRCYEAAGYDISELEENFITVGRQGCPACRGHGYASQVYCDRCGAAYVDPSNNQIIPATKHKCASCKDGVAFHADCFWETKCDQCDQTYVSHEACFDKATVCPLCGVA